MTTPSTDWRRDASVKALEIIAAGTAAHQHLSMLGERIQAEKRNLDRAKSTLEQRKALAATQGTRTPYDTQIDIVARAEADVEHYQSRLDAMLKQRDDVTAQHAPLMRLFSAAKDLVRKFDLD